MPLHIEQAKEKAMATVQRGRQRATLVLAIVEAPESEQIEGLRLWFPARHRRLHRVPHTADLMTAAGMTYGRGAAS